MTFCRVADRVSSKQTKINFGSNQNKICFEFVSVCFAKSKTKYFGVSNLYRKNQNKQNYFVKKPKQNETTLNFLKKPNILSIKLFDWVYCLFRFNQNMETLCFGIEAKQPKQTEEKNQKNPKFFVKNSKICSLSNCFGWSSVCFGSIATSKLSVSVLKWNKRFVSDSSETSCGSSLELK